jgi:hypothetical protein
MDTLNPKQTAIDYLVNNIDWMLVKNCSLHYKMIIEKAKQIQKEEILRARKDVIESYNKNEIINHADYLNKNNY